MAWWLVAALLLAAIPVAGADTTCTGLAPATACATASVPNGTDINATNVSATATLGASSVETGASPYGVFVVARGELVSPVSGVGVYAAPRDEPGSWACIFYAAAGGSSCQTPEELADALAVNSGSYQNLIIDATRLVSCDVRARVCQMPLG